MILFIKQLGSQLFVTVNIVIKTFPTSYIPILIFILGLHGKVLIEGKGTLGGASVRRRANSSQLPDRPTAAGIAEPISNGGGTSGITDLRRNKKGCAASGKRSENI